MFKAGARLGRSASGPTWLRARCSDGGFSDFFLFTKKVQTYVKAFTLEKSAKVKVCRRCVRNLRN
eukprot:GDKH01000542.1.p1 GENE.GDKH01000542.1~~GDKH01000542.1.p1  ORF type:complete len:65 (-),score=2.87 GDKH01000542.1:37-231(-)